MNYKTGVEDYSWPTNTGWQDIALINNLRAKLLEEFKNSLGMKICIYKSNYRRSYEFIYRF